MSESVDSTTVVERQPSHGRTLIQRREGVTGGGGGGDEGVDSTRDLS